MLYHSDNIRILTYICNHAFSSDTNERGPNDCPTGEDYRDQGDQEHKSRQGGSSRIYDIYRNFARDTSFSEAVRVPMYFAPMCLRLLFLTPLISSVGIPNALADAVTPLRLEPDQIQEERLPGEYRETPEDQPQAETVPFTGETAPPEAPTPAQAVPQTDKPASQDVLEELAHLRKALQLEPDEGAPRLRVAQLLYQLGDAEGAIDEFRTLLRFHPDAAPGHLGLGTALMAKQDWRTALVELQEAVRLDPNLVQAFFSMGTIHYTRGSPLAAMQAYREALRLKPDFAEAHYRLGLVLKVVGKDKEAAQEFEVAALSGIAKAQLFLGNAYKSGQGVEKNQVMAITWWSRAFEQGLPEAAQALTQLRRLAAVKGPTQGKQSKAAAESFREFCQQLWLDFPDLERQQPDDTVGVTLLKHHRTAEALPVLLREAYALDIVAHMALVQLYEEGLEGVPKHGQWILVYLESTAADGLIPSRTALARIYGKGIGVPQDIAKAKGFIRGLPKDDAKALLEELTIAQTP